MSWQAWLLCCQPERPQQETPVSWVGLDNSTVWTTSRVVAKVWAEFASWLYWLVGLNHCAVCAYVYPETSPFPGAPARASWGAAAEDGTSVMRFFLPLLCFVVSAFFFGEKMKKNRRRGGKNIVDIVGFLIIHCQERAWDVSGCLGLFTISLWGYLSPM